jgi:hypothetical protein
MRSALPASCAVRVLSSSSDVNVYELTRINVHVPGTLKTEDERQDADIDAFGSLIRKFNLR